MKLRTLLCKLLLLVEVLDREGVDAFAFLTGVVFTFRSLKLIIDLMVYGGEREKRYLI